MLLGGKQSDIKQVAIVTRNQQFNKLLSSILANWKFFAVEDLSEAKVVFAERGIELPELDAKVVWLSPMPLVEGTFLTVPLSLGRLYELLEAQLFPTPRRHIRIAIEANVDLKLENEWIDGRLMSLSGRGCRIEFSREVARGRQIELEVNLGGKRFKLPSEVLYCIAAGDSPGYLKPQVGLLFKPSEDLESGLLQSFIERSCVECACSRENIQLTDPCLSWIDMPSDFDSPRAVY